MKKILSLALAGVMMFSALPMAYAADVNYDQGTQVSYTAANAESYTITVPASLAPGGSGTVTAKGTWPSTKNLRVTADESIEMVNSISTAANKELDITFEPIILAGSQTAEVSTTSDITVEDISDALFGEWKGTINYNVDYVVMLGDVNGDGNVLPNDATQIGRKISGLTSIFDLGNEQTLIAADVNEDGIVNKTDEDLILTYYVNKTSEECPNINTYISLANATVPTIEYYPNLVGDVNGDGQIAVVDLSMINDLVNNALPEGMEISLVCADVNGDMVINATDVEIMRAHAAYNQTVDGSIVGQYRQDVDNSEYTIEYTTTE